MRDCWRTGAAKEFTLALTFTLTFTLALSTKLRNDCWGIGLRPLFPVTWTKHSPVITLDIRLHT